ncbi:MAG: hypothetical protein L0Z50_11180, partial [Verrucomicrobiales bacterium]|nr:hypothetical protein [Verrucomicrobiales bacterium]
MKPAIPSLAWLSGVSMFAYVLACSEVCSRAAEVKWTQLLSKHGDLPAPGPSTQQTGSLIADLDQDGIKDFVLSFRKVAPAVVWYRRTGKSWERLVIEKDF